MERPRADSIEAHRRVLGEECEHRFEGAPVHGGVVQLDIAPQQRSGIHFGIVWAVAVRSLLTILLLGLAVEAKEEPVVRFAGSWDDAVEEAKILNVPIVVHNQCLT